MLPFEAPVGAKGVRPLFGTALANAIIAATEARQWQLVAQLAKELEARRRLSFLYASGPYSLEWRKQE